MVTFIIVFVTVFKKKRGPFAKTFGSAKWRIINNSSGCRNGKTNQNARV